MNGSHIAYADMDLIRDAALSATNENADFPIERVQVDDHDSPVNPFKATTTASVITITLDDDETPDCLAIINHNLEGATVTLANGAGFSQAVEIPSRTRDGLCVNAFFDMRELANRLDDVWTLTITGAAGNIAIGRLVLIATGGLQPVPWLVKTPSYRPERLMSSLKTYAGVELIHDKGIRIRHASGRTIEDADRAVQEAAWDAARGRALPFLFVPETDVNDAWWVRFDSLEWSHDVYQEVSPSAIALSEISMGPHLYA